MGSVDVDAVVVGVERKIFKFKYTVSGYDQKNDQCNNKLL